MFLKYNMNFKLMSTEFNKVKVKSLDSSCICPLHIKNNQINVACWHRLSYLEQCTIMANLNDLKLALTSMGVSVYSLILSTATMLVSRSHVIRTSQFKVWVTWMEHTQTLKSTTVYATVIPCLNHWHFGTPKTEC